MDINALNNLKEECNGLFPDKTKFKIEDVEDVVVTIDDYRKVETEKDHYYAVTLKEYPDNFLLSGSGLTKILDKPFDMNGLQVKFEKQVKTNSGRTYRPVTVIGYEA